MMKLDGGLYEWMGGLWQVVLFSSVLMCLLMVNIDENRTHDMKHLHMYQCEYMKRWPAEIPCCFHSALLSWGTPGEPQPCSSAPGNLLFVCPMGQGFISNLCTIGIHHHVPSFMC